MLKTTRILVMAGVMAAAGSEARAQTQPPPATLGFVNVNFGTQPSSRTVGRSQSFPVYGETATLTTTQEIGNGAVFDITGGYRFGPDLYGPNLGVADWLLELQQYLRQRSRRHHPESAGLRSAANDHHERQRPAAQRARHPSSGGVVRSDHESDRRRAVGRPVVHPRQPGSRLDGQHSARHAERQLQSWRPKKRPRLASTSASMAVTCSPGTLARASSSGTPAPRPTCRALRISASGGSRSVWERGCASKARVGELASW